MTAGVTQWVPLRPQSMASRTQWGAWLNPVEVRVTGTSPADRRVILREPLSWENPDGSTITVPEGWTSDGATLPPATWWLLGGKLALDWIRSAIVHDFACVSGLLLLPSNTAASDLFYRGLRADSMGFNRARLAYHTTRTFGPQWGPSR